MKGTVAEKRFLDTPKKGKNVSIVVESVDNTFEFPAVPLRMEVQDEGVGCTSHGQENALQRLSYLLHPAVGKDRSDQTSHFSIFRRRKTMDQLQRIGLKVPGMVRTVESVQGQLEALQTHRPEDSSESQRHDMRLRPRNQAIIFSFSPPWLEQRGAV